MQQLDVCFKPLKLARWKLSDVTFPEDCRVPRDRVWYAKQLVRERTWVGQETSDSWDGCVPSGFKIFALKKPPVVSTNQVVNELNILFSDVDKLDQLTRASTGQSKSMVMTYKKRGLTYFPSNNVQDYERHGRVIDSGVFRKLLEAHYPNTHSFWSSYETAICEATGMSRAHLESQGKLTVLRYGEGKGLWMHFDNLLRSDSTTFTVGVGRQTVYDLAPSLYHKYSDEAVSALRVNVEDKAVVVMDGSARYQWTHGIPYGFDGVKYTLIFKLKHCSEHSSFIGIEPTFGCRMYSTKLLQ